VDLHDLYQETILDHGRKPRNFGKLEDPTHHAEGFNPMCGDRFTVEIRVEDGVIADAAFQGQGCAISTASASLMLEALVGRPAGDFEALFTTVHTLLTSEGEAVGDPGKLVVFNGVRNFPLRVKCASLPWHTLRAALNREAVASTE